LKSQKTALNSRKNRMRDHATQMRDNPTPAEERLWSVLRRGQLHGTQWRRQYPVIHRYIADFACPQLKVVVEADGAHHGTGKQRGYDKSRDKMMRKAGWLVIRFSNDEILGRLELVQASLASSIAFQLEIRARAGAPGGRD
jgi:very-short-patch-repair endonuclease